MDTKEDTDFNDGEVFFGRMTLKEVKKRILMDIHQKNSRLPTCESNISDFKLIETKSQPNILLPNHREEIVVENLKSISDSMVNKNKQHIYVTQTIPESEACDSFLQIEKNIAEHCISSDKIENNELDNTLDLVDFILNNAQPLNKEKNVNFTNFMIKDVCNDNKYLNDNDLQSEILSQSTNNIEENSHKNNEELKLKSESTFIPTTPIKQEQINQKSLSKPRRIKPEAINTPVCTKKEIPNLFKTPKIPQSGRKDGCLKKTPSRIKAYEHIASPIATYIKNCPQVPLVKEVHPKKPLPSTSSIPKLVKNVSESKIGDKENIVLPQLAYRSAKKTTVIDVNKEKLPQSQWAQKLTSSLRKPVVLKHNHRETGRKPLVSQQDSFADLTLHQAEVSVCTQKLAFTNL